MGFLYSATSSQRYIWVITYTSSTNSHVASHILEEMSTRCVLLAKPLRCDPSADSWSSSRCDHPPWCAAISPVLMGLVLGRGEAWLSQSIPGHTTLAFTPNREGPLIHFIPELPAVRCSGWVENLELVCPCFLKCCIWTASSQKNTAEFPCLILRGLAPHVASLFWAKKRTISFLISEHLVQGWVSPQEPIIPTSSAVWFYVK